MSAPDAARANAHPRWPVRVLIVAGVILALGLLIRLVLDPIAAHYTHKALDESDSVSGDFEKVHVTVFPPGYEISHLKIIEAHGGQWDRPLFFARRAVAKVDWRRLLHAGLSLSLRLDEPKLIVSTGKATGAKPGHLATTPPDIRASLQKLLPVRADRIEVRDGEFLFRDTAAARHPEIWVHHIELAVENVTTRKEIAGGQPATVSARATLGHSGAATFFASADPLAAKPEFAGTLALRDWKVAELYDLEEPTTKLQTPEGTLGLFAKFKVHGGAISGGIKPVLKNVQVRPTEDTFGNKLKAWVADKGIHLFSDRVPDRNAVATVVPIEGRLDQPDIETVPAILGVVRNAFVEGVSAGFAHLPPPAAPETEGMLAQAKQSLQKDKGPPKAQPPKDDSGKDRP